MSLVKSIGEMTPQIEVLDDSNLEGVMDIITKIPLETLTLLADSTQLRDWCDVRILRADGQIEGIFSLYRDLDFLAGAFWCKSSKILQELIIDFGDDLKEKKVVFICTEEQLQCLKEISQSTETILERQMFVDKLSQLNAWGDGIPERLSMNDAKELKTLYGISNTPAWTPNALELGPFFGVRNSNDEIVSVAGVHYLTPCCSEIGNIATHPDYRKKGYASRCTVAVAEELFKKVPLVVIHYFADNKSAQRLYEKMGFVFSNVDPIYFVKAVL
ncbi:MAG: GNAT family N-acetyltransferase [Candidatus Thorarchaeota archaeon]